MIMELNELLTAYGEVTPDIAARAEKANGLFTQGFNCAQSVVGAFADLLPIDENSALKASMPFGGGLARLREVCGSVSGGSMVLGLLFGDGDPKGHAGKAEHYALVQTFAKRFEELNRSIVCRELLGLNVKHSEPTPEARTAEYYKKRPCGELVALSAALVAQLIKANGVEL